MSELSEEIGKLNALATEIKEDSQSKFKEIDEKGAATGQTLEKQELQLKEFDKKFSAIEKRIARASSASDEKSDINHELKSINKLLPSYGHKSIDDVDQYMEIKSIVAKALRQGDKSLTAEEYKSVNGVIDPDGGYLVAPERSTTLGKRKFDNRQVGQNVLNTTIGTSMWKEPFDNALYADGVFESELSSAGVDVSTNEFKEISIAVGDLYFPKVFSRSVLMDSYINLDTEVLDSIRMGNDRQIASGVLNGLGTTLSPLKGILTYDNGTDWNQIEQISSTVDNAIDWDDVLDLLPSALGDGYLENAAFFMRRQTLNKLLISKDLQDRYQVGNQIQFFSNERLPLFINGIPVLFDIGMPAVADGALAVGLADLEACYRKVNRVGFSIHRDDSSAKFVTLTGRNRVGGGVRNGEACKLLVIQ